MTRKEVFAKIRELQLEDAVKTKYGKNYTLISNTDLEAMIAEKEQSTEKLVEESAMENPGNVDCSIVVAFVTLVSRLRANRILSQEDADAILSYI